MLVSELRAEGIVGIVKGFGLRNEEKEGVAK